MAVELNRVAVSLERTIEDQIADLETAIAAQERLRPTLGDAVVQTALRALRAQRDALRAQRAPVAGVSSESESRGIFARLQRYLPQGLADKMRGSGRVAGERRQVTVLFADVSGYTALAERLDPEDVAALSDSVLREFAAPIYQFEGYIDHYAGDSILALFGAPVAHEDDAERALRAALAIRDRLEAVNRRWSHRLVQPLRAHVGINSGLVVAGDVGHDLHLQYTVMGDTINTASRLQAAASPGQILVSRDTYRLAHEAFTFVALEPIVVRGKQGPLTPFELERARLRPGKSRGLKDLPPTFVGRGKEIARLRSMTRDLQRGRGGIVAITGEAGIGKSRLIAEWRKELGDQVWWLEGHAFAHTTALAYGPFLDMLRAYAGITDDDSEAEARARLEAAVERYFPGDTETRAILANVLAMRLTADETARIATYPSDKLRQRLFALVEEWLRKLLLDRPTVLLIEDMQWADSASLELIEYLLPMTEEAELAIVGAFRLRADEPASRLQTRAEARYPDLFTHIPLARLDDAQSIAMVQNLLATPVLPEALRALILEKADGNPFFVEELIRTLISRGVLVQESGSDRWVATPLMGQVSIPDTLQGMLMARLDRLPDETKRTAQQASVIGRMFPYRVLLKISDLAAGLHASLNRLEREEVIRVNARHPEIEYIFNHAMTHEVAYQSLLGPRRRELHRRVGEAMETIFAERLASYYNHLADHFSRGESWDKALRYFIQAGDADARLYAYTEAHQKYASAMDVLGHLPDTDEYNRERIDTTVKLASVSWGKDRPAENLARLAVAESLAAHLPGPDGAPGSDTVRIAQIQNWIGRMHYYRNETREAIGRFRKVLAVAATVGDRELAAFPSAIMGRAVLFQGRFDVAEELLGQAARLLEEVSDWPERNYTNAFLGAARAARGRCSAGLAECECALARAEEINNLTIVAGCHAVLFFVHMMRGDPPRMMASSRKFVDVAQKSGNQVLVYLGFAYSAWSESRLGQHAAAARSIGLAKAVARDLGGRLVLRDWVAAAEAEIAVNAGKIEEAVAGAEEALRVGKLDEGIFGEGLAHRTWAIALMAADQPRWDEVESHLAASLSALIAGDCRVEAARTRQIWGQMCNRRGDPSGAFDQFQRAAEEFAAAELVPELELVQQYQRDAR